MSAETASLGNQSAAHPGLPGRDYCSPEIFEIEKERIFYRSWFCVGREERLPKTGDFLTEEITGEDILVVRTREGELRAFYNVCRHRGTKLCEAASGHVNRAFVCPYHAWSYALDGRLQHTPNVRDGGGIDREKYGLRSVSLETWDGFIFVNLASDPRPLVDQLEIEPGKPLSWRRYRTGELRVAHRIEYEIQANWKILHDNFNECLHCPSVHPELAKLVPLYRTGQVVDHERADGGVTLDEGLDTFTLSGRSALPRLPGLSELDSRSYYGYATFPNLMVNLLSTGVVVFTLSPRAADHTTLVSEFLFRPEVIARSDFDCSDMVKFIDLVSVQDWAVCERVQRGVASRGFNRGIYSAEDGILHEFAERYLSERGPAPDATS